jgi:Cys-tRNA synthase (O-phospho-L-seryl-tRNA:Cys-tRNA synthase)
MHPEKIRVFNGARSAQSTAMEGASVKKPWLLQDAQMHQRLYQMADEATIL